jgi:hypothetical protein
VDTSQGSSLDRGANSVDLRLSSVPGLQIPKELKVVGIWVIGCEPSLTGNCGWSIDVITTAWSLQTSVNAHLAFLCKSCANVLVQHFALSDQRSQGVDILGRNDNV